MGAAPARRDGAAGAPRDDVLRRAHLVIIVAGVALLSSLSLYTDLWFDESYSVALVRHSLGDIWRIATNDVHPPLYYYLLKLVWFCFGDNVVAYRLFSVAGLGCLALLGYTHVRRDFGGAVGLAFSFLTLATPWSFRMSSQIRMYAWSAFFVGLCLVCGLRVIRALREAREAGTRPELPLRCWVALCLSSVASANSHYFALMAAFSVNACVIAALVCCRRCVRGTSLPRRYLVTAALAVVSFVPWVGALLGQAHHVSQYFWVRLDLPRALLQVVCFPFLDSDLASIDRPVMGDVAQALTLVGSLAFVALVAVAVALSLRDRRRALRARGGKGVRHRLPPGATALVTTRGLPPVTVTALALAAAVKEDGLSPAPATMAAASVTGPLSSSPTRSRYPPWSSISFPSSWHSSRGWSWGSPSSTCVTSIRGLPAWSLPSRSSRDGSWPTARSLVLAQASPCC